MGTWRNKKPWLVKELNTRSLKGYKRASKNQLKQGDYYYLKDPWKDSVSKRMVFDPVSRRPIEKYYIEEINMQIGWGFIYIKE